VAVPVSSCYDHWRLVARMFWAIQFIHISLAVSHVFICFYGTAHTDFKFYLKLKKMAAGTQKNPFNCL
jgi:hypothetical protein